ncbi:MAG: glycosyl transferase family 1, partial [Bacteroidales bacterium]|nr:glycosyl transferase family 1 [Bacteroidales bacterium]
MKITILGTAYPYRGGIAAFNERLAREFAAEGDSVDLITFTLQYPSFLFPGKTQYSSDAAPTDLSIRRMVNSCNPVNWIKVGNKIKRERPDLLVIGFWIPLMAPALGTIARIARSNKHTRVISILHNVIPHEKRAGDTAFA